MVIGTSAIVNVELDGAVGMNSGIFNNPFMIWGSIALMAIRLFYQSLFNSIIRKWMVHTQANF